MNSFYEKFKEKEVSSVYSVIQQLSNETSIVKMKDGKLGIIGDKSDNVNENYFDVMNMLSSYDKKKIIIFKLNDMVTIKKMLDAIYNYWDSNKSFTFSDLLAIIMELVSNFKENTAYNGLFGELLYIYQNGEDAIKAWQNKGGRQFDFYCLGSEVDVKTSSNLNGTIVVSSNQISKTSEIIAYKLSYSESGLTLLELKNEIIQKYKSNLFLEKFIKNSSGIVLEGEKFSISKAIESQTVLRKEGLISWLKVCPENVVSSEMVIKMFNR